MKLTKICVALVGVMAVMAVGATGASAALEEFKATSSPAMLFGEQKTGEDHVFTVDGQEVKCNKAVFEKGSQTAPTKTIAGVTAAYSECTAFGFVGATVNMGTCTYTFLQPNSLVGNVGIACGAGGKIIVKASFLGSTCEVEIAESGNTNMSKLEYTNLGGSPSKVKVTANVSGIKVNKLQDTFACPLSGKGASEATYKGPTTVEATAGIGISIS